MIYEQNGRQKREENSNEKRGQETEDTKGGNREDITTGIYKGDKKTHIDTETRTTGNKSGACVRGHTKHSD